jgi:hypothetical protein
MENDLAGIVKHVAGVVRQCYCDERNQWHRVHERKKTMWGLNLVPRYDGGEDSHGRVHQNMWERVARFVIRNRLDPRRFVRAQFAIRDSKPIEPTSLLTDQAISLYHHQAQTDDEEIRRLFDFQRRRALAEFDKLMPCRTSRGWTDGDINRAVLGNMLVPLSALFRYCLTKRDGHEDLAETFAQEAVVQYLAQPSDYDKVWGDWIPQALKDLAAKLDVFVAGTPTSTPTVADVQRQRPPIVME